MHGSIRIGTKLETKEFDKQIKYIENQIKNKEQENINISTHLEQNSRDSLLDEIADIDSKIKKLNSEKIRIETSKDLTDDAKERLKTIKEEILKNNASIKRLNEAILQLPKKYELQIKNEKEIEELRNKIIDIRNQAKQTNNEISKSPKNISENFNKSFSSIKRFAGALLSIRGIYSLISKASNAYLETDEKTTNTIKSNWIGLGAVLQPAIELITQLMRKATTGVLYFLSALTKQDLIQKANNAIIKANTNLLKDNTKAKKENEKFTYGFDEMNIQSSSSESATSTSTSSNELLPLFSIKDIGNDTRNVLDKIALALKPIKKLVEDVINFSEEHPDVVSKILGGSALVLLLGKILGIGGVGGTGLLGILSVLGTIAAIGTIYINIKAQYDSFKDAKNTIDEIKEKREEHVNQTIEETDKILEQIPAMKKNNKEVKELTNKIDSNVKTQRNLANVAKENRDNLHGIDLIVAHLTGEYELYGKQIQDATFEEFLQLRQLSELYDQGKLNEEEIEDYKEKLKSFSYRVSGTSESARELQKEFQMTAEDTALLSMMQNFASENMGKTRQNMDAGKLAVEGYDDVLKQFNNDLKNTPTNKKVNIDASTINTAKDKANELFSTLSNIGKKNVTATVSLKFKNAAESIFSMNSEAANFISQLTSSTTKKYGATGGIVNNPGRGVPVTNSIYGGEAGEEGLIPLTDMATMEKLGQAIGKYVVVNFTNITKLDSKEIAHEQKKINNELDFINNWR